MKNHNFFWPFIILTLTACAPAPYAPKPGVDTAKIKIPAQYTWICDDNGHTKRLQADEKGYATVPSGKKVIVGISYSFDGYNVRYFCEPRISFTPVKDGSYFQHFQLESEKCATFIYRETTENRTGLDFEPSMEPAGYCKRPVI